MLQPPSFLRSPFLGRALVLGALAGAALILVQVFSTRGPLVFLPYAAMFAALAPLLARHHSETFVVRATAGFAAFMTATIISYAYIRFWANPGLPHISLIGLVRFTLVIGVGIILAIAVAFVVGDDSTPSKRAA